MDKNEIEKLRERVAAGNDKLNAALNKIHEIQNPEEHQKQLDRWYESKAKLIKLTDQLNQAGFFDCLYQSKRCFDNDGNVYCLVCPDMFWINPNEKKKPAASAKIISDKTLQSAKELQVQKVELEKFLFELGDLI